MTQNFRNVEPALGFACRMGPGRPGLSVRSDVRGRPPALHAWLHETGIREDDPRRRLSERVQAFLALLNEELDRIGRTGVALFRRLCTDPVAKLLRGDALTREEHRILQAMGLPLATAKTAGLRA